MEKPSGQKAMTWGFLTSCSWAVQRSDTTFSDLQKLQVGIQKVQNLWSASKKSNWSKWSGQQWLGDSIAQLRWCPVTSRFNLWPPELIYDLRIWFKTGLNDPGSSDLVILLLSCSLVTSYDLQIKNSDTNCNLPGKRGTLWRIRKCIICEMNVYLKRKLQLGDKNVNLSKWIILWGAEQ